MTFFINRLYSIVFCILSGLLYSAAAKADSPSKQLNFYRINADYIFLDDLQDYYIQLLKSNGISLKVQNNQSLARMKKSYQKLGYGCTSIGLFKPGKVAKAVPIFPILKVNINLYRSQRVASNIPIQQVQTVTLSQSEGNIVADQHKLKTLELASIDAIQKLLKNRPVDQIVINNFFMRDFQQKNNDHPFVKDFKLHKTFSSYENWFNCSKDLPLSLQRKLNTIIMKAYQDGTLLKAYQKFGFPELLPDINSFDVKKISQSFLLTDTIHLLKYTSAEAN